MPLINSLSRIKSKQVLSVAKWISHHNNLPGYQVIESHEHIARPCPKHELIITQIDKHKLVPEQFSHSIDTAVNNSIGSTSCTHVNYLIHIIAMQLGVVFDLDDLVDHDAGLGMVGTDGQLCELVVG